MSTHQFQPDLPPPSNTVGAVGWMRKNLFNGPVNSIVTIILAYLAFTALWNIVDWAFINADWVGTTRDACSREGACWVFISVRWDQFMYGFYPEAELWRPRLFYISLAILTALVAYEKTPKRMWIWLFLVNVYPFLVAGLLYGGVFGLEVVDTHKWGGLLVTLIIALVGIVVSLPIGIVLALGRRSDMPIIRSMCTVYIEVWRGVPLITVLFMASVMLPLFMSEGSETDKLIRALIGVVMFAAAYMAEVIRGGLQAIPKGQYEAADALGLSYWKKTGLIILPQALKITIPSIVNTFIGLFKDTSLVLIIGMFDVLGIGQAANTDPEWLGFATESYVFVALVFWVFCFGMSRYSIWLENKLHTGHKR
ncbi:MULTISPECIES: amino acid ABC transporter permease [Vibrio]|jgi:general L-amino acid transport system permease protein|uniref:Amino acid ABC transporter permease n=1 Tax=Vibrio natriegens NBRC 15636 = ATCC 14048 = DSM 759 TaxID=1219067 RepID=A0AAN0Y2V9_VIBNA|nr:MULTISPECIES: amino acid ABC transporter permease [Vibrio]MEE3877864.1 amino acid ABC transporter permease [Vibrio sp. YYF0003]ALR15462.1 amino acid ABC transporter permease [Vibrio natriegens NBRC 15636 = ATCC 14048 = DSM 759]ANQ12678.1 amino acid ABC transporter permease [Vibrio natriegens NBRC 15636 = ATCC 14048 = DSM 759]ANQ17161.1 amino acid ABC transporter permease [Vibrio natriegens]ANQ21680.1 amino acid ABC transporter permease [Vibrio natriegens]